MDIDIPSFVKDYLSCKTNPRGDINWAVELLDFTLVHDAPTDAWPLILELVKAARTKTHLSRIAAGPLEDILYYHGPDFIEKIENEARRSKRFAWTVLGVWPSEKNKEIYTRFRKLQENYRTLDIDLPEK